MPSAITYEEDPNPRTFAVNEQGIEEGFIEKLRDLKYTDLVPLLKKRAAGRDISGLNAYET